MSIKIDTSSNNTTQFVETKLKESKLSKIAQNYFKDTNKDAEPLKEKIFNKTSARSHSISKSQKTLAKLENNRKKISLERGNSEKIDQIMSEIQQKRQAITQRINEIQELVEDCPESYWGNSFFEELELGNFVAPHSLEWKDEFQICLKEGVLLRQKTPLKNIESTKTFLFIQDLDLSPKHGSVVSFTLIFRKIQKVQKEMIADHHEQNEIDEKDIKKLQKTLADSRLSIIEKKINAIKAYLSFYSVNNE